MCVVVLPVNCILFKAAVSILITVCCVTLLSCTLVLFSSNDVEDAVVVLQQAEMKIVCVLK